MPKLILVIRTLLEYSNDNLIIKGEQMTVNAYIQQNQHRFTKYFAELISKRSLSETGEGIDETVDYLTDLLKTLLHAEVQVVETEGNPVILATLSPGKAQTYLFYGHYDVQSVGNLHDWRTDPFSLTEEDGRFYGRGCGDNKGQLLAQILGIYTYLQLHGDLPFTLRLFIEGEEEIGSPHLQPTVASLNKQLLADVDDVFVMDGSFSQSGKHVLRLGNRGVLAFRLSTQVADHDLHSGNFGNVSRNAALELLNALNKLVDPSTYHVKVPGFYDKVQGPSQAEEQWLSELPMPTDVPSPLFKDKHDYYRRLMFMPTLTINSLTSGYQCDYIKTIIPHQACAVVDCRLVAGQTCQEVKGLIKKALADELASGRVQLHFLAGLDPTKMDPHLPLIRRVQAAIKKGTGDCLIEPVMPGSVPNYIWVDELHVPVFTIPLANYDQHNHAPNENLQVQAFWDGISLIANLCFELGKENTERG